MSDKNYLLISSTTSISFSQTVHGSRYREQHLIIYIERKEGLELLCEIGSNLDPLKLKARGELPHKSCSGSVDKGDIRAAPQRM